MATPISGTEGRVEVNGTVLNLSKWSVNPTVAPLPYKHFESSGYDSPIAGFITCEIDVEGDWDADANPHADPPNFKAGQILTNVYLYVRRTGSRRFAFPSALVVSVPVSNEAEGKVRVSCKLQSRGSFTYPT